MRGCQYGYKGEARVRLSSKLNMNMRCQLIDYALLLEIRTCLDVDGSRVCIKL